MQHPSWLPVYAPPYAIVGDDDMIPAGVICLWSGAVIDIPVGWALCDGTNGTPDLFDRFVIGADAAIAGTVGGATSPRDPLPGHAAHAVTQPADHAAHAVTQPGAHAAHVVTQPGAHAAHVVTQPGAHAAHVVTQPSNHADHASHTHDIASQLTTPDLFTSNTGGTGVSGRSGGPSAALAHGAHAGTAVDAHSAHAGTAVDAHSAHAGTAVDAHSAHAGTAVDAHSAHGGTAVDPHSAHVAPLWYALAYIMKL